jgi:hypothetical protein
MYDFSASQACPRTETSEPHWRILLKGQCHKIFCFQVFFMNHVPSKPSKITVVSFRIFCLNSRRYSQVKVHHRYQRHGWQICHPWILSCEYLREGADWHLREESPPLVSAYRTSLGEVSQPSEATSTNLSGAAFQPPRSGLSNLKISDLLSPSLVAASQNSGGEEAQSSTRLPLNPSGAASQPSQGQPLSLLKGSLSAFSRATLFSYRVASKPLTGNHSSRAASWSLVSVASQSLVESSKLLI